MSELNAVPFLFRKGAATICHVFRFHRRPSCEAKTSTNNPAFERSSKRRKGYPSETKVKRGMRVVHGEKELVEKLGRNDLCPCGSGRCFQTLLSPQRQIRRHQPPLLFSASSSARSRRGQLLICAPSYNTFNQELAGCERSSFHGEVEPAHERVELRLVESGARQWIVAACNHKNDYSFLTGDAD